MEASSFSLFTVATICERKAISGHAQCMLQRPMPEAGGKVRRAPTWAWRAVSGSLMSLKCRPACEPPTSLAAHASAVGGGRVQGPNRTHLDRGLLLHAHVDARVLALADLDDGEARDDAILLLVLGDLGRQSAPDLAAP